MNDSPRDFVMPRPAATVVVVREAVSAPEVLMVKRHARAAFASSYVFPGGVLEPDDDKVLSRCDQLTAAQADASLGLESGGLRYYSAAFREVLEETGVLLPVPGNDAAIDAANGTAIDTEAARRGLNDDTLRWSDFLDQHDLRLPCGSLHYIAYWVTPRSERKRFSTRFFIAEMPAGQEAMHDEGELTDSCWMTPRDVLRQGTAGMMKLPYPTRSTLRDIAGFGSIGEIIAWAKTRSETGIARQLPAFVTVRGKDMVVMPGSPYYPDDVDA